MDAPNTTAPGINEMMALVQRTCQRILGSTHPAVDDAAQAVFLVYWRKRVEIAQHPHLAAWFQRTAVLVCRQELRSQRRRRFHEGKQQTLADQSDQTLDDESTRALEEELAEIPKRYAEVLTRQYILEQTREQISSAMNIPAGTVASWAQRGREALKKRLVRRGITAAGLTGLSAITATTSAATTNAASLASPVATKLAEEALRQFLLVKLKIAATALAAITLGISGAIAATPRNDEAPPPAPVVQSTNPDHPWSDPRARRVMAVAAPPARPVQPIRHTVTETDTLESISYRYYQVTSKISAILAANPDLTANTLTAGTTINIPTEARPVYSQGHLDFTWLRKTAEHAKPATILFDAEAQPLITRMEETMRLWPLLHNDDYEFPVIDLFKHGIAASFTLNGKDHVNMLWDAGAAQDIVNTTFTNWHMDGLIEHDQITVHYNNLFRNRDEPFDGEALLAHRNGLSGLTSSQHDHLLAIMQTPGPLPAVPQSGLHISGSFEHYIERLLEFSADPDVAAIHETLLRLADHPPHLTGGITRQDDRFATEWTLTNAPNLGLRPIDSQLLARLGTDHHVSLAAGLDIPTALTTLTPLFEEEISVIAGMANQWLDVCTGDVAIGVSWPQPVDPQRPAMIGLIGLSNSKNFFTRLEPLLKQSGFQPQTHVDAQVWTGNILEEQWWVALSDDFACVTNNEQLFVRALAQPNAIDQNTPAISLSGNLPELATWALPLVRNLVDLNDLKLDRAAWDLFGQPANTIGEQLAKEFTALGPQAGLKELLASPGGQSLRLAEQWLGTDSLLKNVTVYRSTDGKTALLWRSGDSSWKLRTLGQFALDPDSEPDVHAALLQDISQTDTYLNKFSSASWYIVGPQPSNLTPLPHIALFDPAWIPTDEVIIRHLPQYDLRLYAGADLTIKELGLPIISLLATAITIDFIADGPDRFRRQYIMKPHFQQVLAQDGAAIRARHADRITIFRKAAQALHHKARDHKDLWHQEYAQWPHNPGWLIRNNIITMAEATLLAKQPIGSAKDFQQVGNWQQSWNLLHSPNRVDSLAANELDRLWTIELEPGWHATLLKSNMKVVITPWPSSTDPNPEQLKPAPAPKPSKQRRQKKKPQPEGLLPPPVQGADNF